MTSLVLITELVALQIDELALRTLDLLMLTFDKSADVDGVAFSIIDVTSLTLLLGVFGIAAFRSRDFLFLSATSLLR